MHNPNNPTLITATAAVSIPRQRGPRRSLEELLARRDVLGATVMVRISHGLSDEEAFRELVLIELSLSHCWATEYAARADDWIVRDAAFIHDPTSARHPDCELCHSESISVEPLSQDAR